MPLKSKDVYVTQKTHGGSETTVESMLPVSLCFSPLRNN